ncbi:MAG: hypothetical protein HYT80_02905 [Euryarchaeota archaeon]|nr:hypothetical protein [Euryarchaeota archaeon]
MAKKLSAASMPVAGPNFFLTFHTTSSKVKVLVTAATSPLATSRKMPAARAAFASDWSTG